VRFIDTNIILYSISRDPADAAKRETAEMLLLATDLALSVQVLQEFYAQATKSARKGALTHEQAGNIVRSMKRYPVLDNTTEIFDDALAIRERWQLSIWDAMIIAAAGKLGCDQVLTEDMPSGQVINGVRIVNPFR
jgi:predicted nucleic acid-binding protein